MAAQSALCHPRAPAVCKLPSKLPSDEAPCAPPRVGPKRAPHAHLSRRTPCRLLGLARPVCRCPSAGPPVCPPRPRLRGLRLSLRSLTTAPQCSFYQVPCSTKAPQKSPRALAPSRDKHVQSLSRGDPRPPPRPALCLGGGGSTRPRPRPPTGPLRHPVAHRGRPHPGASVRTFPARRHVRHRQARP